MWCIEEARTDLLNRWDYKKNGIDPFHISKATGKKYYFLCPNGQHDSEQFYIYPMTEGKVHEFSCSRCNSFAQWGTNKYGDGFLKDYWDYSLNVVSPWDIAKESNKKVYIKCQKDPDHGSFLITPNHFYNGKSCPYCSKNSGKIHPKDSLGYIHPELVPIWSEKNTDSIYQISSSSGRKCWFKCSNHRHEDYERLVCGQVKNGADCPFCNAESRQSRLQTKVSQYIKQNYPNYTLLHENECTETPINPRTNRPMFFDNEVKEISLFIEVHGEQHYKINQFTTFYAKRKKISTKEAFDRQKERDLLKKNYVESKGYHYLELPYFSINNDDYKKLIDDSINNIIQNL